MSLAGSVAQAAQPSHLLDAAHSLHEHSSAEVPVDPVAAMESAAGIGPFLDQDGYLALPEGYSGSLDPAGFGMVLGKNGAPRFRAKGGAADPDARWDEHFILGDGCDGPVRAIVAGLDGEIYLGGEFLSCGGVAANHVVRFDPGTATWSALGSGGGNGVSSWVHALAVSDSGLFVGGNFPEANVGAAIPARNIARWDGSAWSALGSGGGNGVSGTVRSLAVSGGDLYVGGAFWEANANIGTSITASHIARWDGNTWSALGSDGGLGVNSIVNALAVLGGELYVGGEFTQANFGAEEVTANRIARWNGSTWSALGSGGGNGVNNSVFALAVSGSELYVGGQFTQANVGVAIPAHRIARWDGSSWSALGSEGGNGVYGTVFSLAVSGSELYVGGWVFAANVEPLIFTNSIARWDGGAWSALGGGGGNGVSGTVWALAASGSDLYVGGVFNEANVGATVTANHIARWDGGAWSALGSGEGNGVNSVVRALAVFGSELYVGGEFTTVGGIAANRVARWDGSAWSALGSGGGNGMDNTVWTLAVSGNDLYVGGAFTEANLGAGISANRIARWDGSAWSALGSGAGNGMNDLVLALAVSGSTLYVGGQFTQANLGDAIPANRIAHWNGSAWSALGSGGGNGVSSSVWALAVSGSDLYVGGAFTEANVGAAIPANRIARWNGSAWSALGSGGGNGVNSWVYALAVSGSDLYVGGAFWEANVGAAIPADMIARWDGSSWSALGNGTSNAVLDLALWDPDTLYVGGIFLLAGNKPSSRIGRYTTRGTLDVSFAGTGSGSVASSPTGIACPGDCSAAFSWDQPITLTATANASSVFVGWTGGGCNGTDPCVIDFDQDIAVSAEFALLSYAIGGTLTGLVGDQVVLQNNGDDDLTLTGNGGFTFATELPDLSAYDVTVLTDPDSPSQTCTVTNGDGVLAGANITDVEVNCTTNSYTIGGTVSGLKGSGLMLRNNGGDDLAISSEGPFTFAAALLDLSSYSVTVHIQPGSPDQECMVNDGTGTVNGGAVTTVQVSCETLGIETTSMVLSVSPPPREGQPIPIPVQVAAATAPSAGTVTVLASTGESCNSVAPLSSGPGVATWSCELTFSSLGPRTLTANYSGSPGYQPSSSEALAVLVMHHADIAVSADDGVPAVQPGSPAAYLVRIENAGPDSAPNTALITDADPLLLVPAWTCFAFGGAACPAPSGLALPSFVLDLPAGSAVEFLVEGDYDDPLPLHVLFSAEATVNPSAPHYVYDPNSGDNQAVDQNATDLIYCNGFEQP